jgi:DNA-binding transcriptional MerR regulator
MKLFYTIDEVAEHFNVPISTIEHYVKYFSIKVFKSGKIRKFNDANIEHLSRIIVLVQKEGFTLEGAKEKLKTKNKNSVKNIELINQLENIKMSLGLLKSKIDAGELRF